MIVLSLDLPPIGQNLSKKAVKATFRADMSQYSVCFKNIYVHILRVFVLLKKKKNKKLYISVHY